MSDKHKFVEIITFIYAFVIIVGSLGNMATIITICKRWSSLKNTEVFIFVLAVIDLFLSSTSPVLHMCQLDVITLPLLSDFGCQFFHWLLVTLITQSSWVMVAIAVDRFIMIVVKPYSLRRSTEKWKILIISFAMFLLSSTVGVLSFYRVASFRGQRCLIAYKSPEEDLIHSASIFAITMAIPAFILTILYASMISKLRKPVDFQENIRAQQIRTQRNWKIVKLFLSIIIIFYVTAVPYQILHMIYSIHWMTLTRRGQEFFFFALPFSRAITNLNYCIDPFIYASFYIKDITGKIKNAFLRHRSPGSDLRETHSLQAVNTR